MSMALDRIEEFVRSRSPHMVVTPDSSAIVRAQTDTELAEIMRSADLVTPDGAGVVWVARIFGLPLWERVTGCDLMQRICERGTQRGWRIYLLGAAPGIAEQAAARLAERCPGIQVAGTHHGYFTPEQEPEIVSAIAAARSDILFVAFGIPKQEKWIRRHLQALGVPVAIGVGGSFDVVAGRVSRAPQWMGRLGLEWLYRTLREPRRLGRALTIPRFLAMAILDRLRSQRVAAGKRRP
ncbi:N-acetylmannosaminyltransferase [candidate division KD3-62 bacterium DG_56]|uniref:N-acetylmannosaminyltransferase n=1 Tax=candidate division KD3-62 bacterium DG_56 TaxID=1704032 RepID=A0A0S7XNE4_9BACT|nr:MAG: N-acetylmannosaminyltransferase [candidate division KD3-62 bacterium DG_56]